ncbi:hypothetical protein TPA0906_10990 [Streptomyces olivaceus]|nr:hypothetical protein TPA0906_10990 [Streptomyces olivaceus]
MERASPEPAHNSGGGEGRATGPTEHTSPRRSGPYQCTPPSRPPERTHRARIARIAHAAEAEATAATDPLARRVDGVPGAEVRAGYPLMARFTRNPDPSAQLRPGCP